MFGLLSWEIIYVEPASENQGKRIISNHKTTLIHEDDQNTVFHCLITPHP